MLDLESTLLYANTDQRRYLGVGRRPFGVGRRAFRCIGVGRRAFRGFSSEDGSRGGAEGSSATGRFSTNFDTIVCSCRSGGRSLIDLDQTSKTFSSWSSQRTRGVCCRSRVRISRVKQTRHRSLALTFFLASNSPIVLWVEFCWPLTREWVWLNCWKYETQISAQLQLSRQNNADGSWFGKRSSLFHLKFKPYVIFLHPAPGINMNFRSLSD